MRVVLRGLAAVLGAALCCYPAYQSVSDWLTTRARFPRYAEPTWRVSVELGLLYGGVLLGVLLYARHVGWVAPAHHIGGRSAFTGGLLASAALFGVGFVGPLLYGAVTRTDVGVAPILGVIWGSMGLVLAVGAAFVTYGLTGGPPFSASRRAAERSL